jgi:four helix bundle protein
MESTKSFRDLIVWQKAHNFVLSIYKNTESFPKNEMFGLTSQLRRASVSIAANLVEGYKKKSKLDKLRFMNIAQGSLEETRYYLILVNDLKYIDSSELMLQLEEVSKMLNSYCSKIIESRYQ